MIAAGDLAQRSASLGAAAVDFLRRDLQDLKFVRDCRGQGLFLGIEFSTPGKGAEMMDALRAKGIIALPSGNEGQVLSITPALNIPEELLSRGLQIIAATARELSVVS
jgi:4-aminobutyrate aminotransferase-like enzyme